MKKLAIVCGSPSSEMLAPFDEPDGRQNGEDEGEEPVGDAHCCGEREKWLNPCQIPSLALPSEPKKDVIVVVLER